jgi:hypothetical protein
MRSGTTSTTIPTKVAKPRSRWTAIRGIQRQPLGVGLGEVLDWVTSR